MKLLYQNQREIRPNTKQDGVMSLHCFMTSSYLEEYDLPATLVRPLVFDERGPSPLDVAAAISNS